MKYKKGIMCLFSLFLLTSCLNLNDIQKQKKNIKQSSILLLNITGIITTELSESFMEYIRTYAHKEKIKGVLIRVNSPGGTVGASQEMHSAIREIKDFYKKPVFVSGGDLVASGAVYSIMSADKIFINEGTLFGSIGVLMEFHNYSELIRWAKVDIYNLKAGEFKDSGSPYRQMTLRERELFETLMENTMDQFKTAIINGRNLDPKAVEAFSDGRIFSGEEALNFELVDAIGSFNQAIRAIGERTGLGSTPHLFDPGAKTSYEKFFESFSGKSPFLLNTFFSKLSKIDQLAGQPLYILPSYISAHK